MKRIGRVVDLFLEGKTPKQIAATLQCSRASVESNLTKAALNGDITFVEICLCLREEIEDENQLADNADSKIKALYIRSQRSAGTRGRNRQTFERQAIAEHYLQIRELERYLHQTVRESLESTYGANEDGWWRKGIKRETREACLSRRERDAEGTRYEPFAYTTLGELKGIIQSGQSKKLEFAFFNGLSGAERQEFLDNFERLNAIRNSVMHPVRVDVPSDEQFRFIQDLHDQIIP